MCVGERERNRESMWVGGWVYMCTLGYACVFKVLGVVIHGSTLCVFVCVSVCVSVCVHASVCAYMCHVCVCARTHTLESAHSSYTI